MKYQPRILWTIGQTLLPEHMQGLEDSLLSDVALRSTLSGLPIHGFSSLVLGDSLQSNGIITLERGTLVSRLGRLIQIGQNGIPDTLNLNHSGRSITDVYLHLMVPENRQDRRSGDRQSARSQDELIPRWKWRLHLSLEENVQGAVEYLFLGRFSKDANSEWTLVPEAAPALISLGGEGFFHDEITELSGRMDRYEKKLMEEAADIQLSGENLIQVRTCLLELRSLRAFVKNVLSEIRVHPFVFHDRLFNFYLKLANYQNREPDFSSIPYQHDALGSSLLPLILLVSDLLEASRTATPMLPFMVDSGVMTVSIDEQSANASRWFLLVQKPQVASTLDLESVKFASTARLNIVHKYYLPGIQVLKIDRPIFQHYFGPEIDVYEFQPDEEWRQALLDHNVAFLNESRFSDIRFYLYWSKG
jgi:type VI secretion system protein ImpJ